MLSETQSATAAQPPPGCRAICPAILRQIDHFTWTESRATLPICSVSSTCCLESNPFLDRNQGVCLNVDAFEDKKQLAAVHGELQGHGVHAPETALVQETGVPGGIQATTLSRIVATPLFGKDGRVIGRFFEDSDARYCMLGDIRPDNPDAPRGEQATNVLNAMQRALTDAGMHFRHVVRTWFYNENLLDWYADFNHARTEFFRHHRIQRMPASTGIGVANAGGAALVAKAVAVQPKTRFVSVHLVESPLQHEASAYGSSFSRAMEVTDRAGRILYISGTASILPNGKTAHIGDASAQIEKTMEVVGAILKNNGMNLTDTTRAIAYFRHREHIPLWEQYCVAHRLPPLPVILTQCDVCRDNLLFEIELDAARSIPGVHVSALTGQWSIHH